MRESAVKTAMVKEVKRAGGYGRRIEDQFGVGILDVILIPKGCPVVFFVEAKIIGHNLFGPTERQWVEMDRIRSTECAGAMPILIGWKNGVHYISRIERQVDYRACFPQQPGWSFLQTLQEFYNLVK